MRSKRMPNTLQWNAHEWNPQGDAMNVREELIDLPVVSLPSPFPLLWGGSSAAKGRGPS